MKYIISLSKIDFTDSLLRKSITIDRLQIYDLKKFILENIK